MADPSTDPATVAAEAQVVYALHPFNAEAPDELTFPAGEPILVLEKDEDYGDGWWEGRLRDGSEGLFPANYTTSSPIDAAAGADPSIAQPPVDGAGQQGEGMYPPKGEAAQDDDNSSIKSGTRPRKEPRESMRSEKDLMRYRSIKWESRATANGLSEKPQDMSESKPETSDGKTIDQSTSQGIGGMAGMAANSGSELISNLFQSFKKNVKEASNSPNMPNIGGLSLGGGDKGEQKMHDLSAHLGDRSVVTTSPKAAPQSTNLGPPTTGYGLPPAGDRRPSASGATPHSLNPQSSMQGYGQSGHAPVHSPPQGHESQGTLPTDRTSSSSSHPSLSNALNAPVDQRGSFQSRHPSTWSVTEVHSFIHTSGFPNQASKFSQNEISGDVLLDLDSNALKEIEINALGKRWQIMQAINGLRELWGLPVAGGPQNGDRPATGRQSSAWTDISSRYSGQSSRRPSAAAALGDVSGSSSIYHHSYVSQYEDNSHSSTQSSVGYQLANQQGQSLHPQPPMPSQGEIHAMWERKKSEGQVPAFQSRTASGGSTQNGVFQPANHAQNPYAQSQSQTPLQSPPQQIPQNTQMQASASMPNMEQRRPSQSPATSPVPDLVTISEPLPVPDICAKDLTPRPEFDSPLKMLADNSGYATPESVGSVWKKRHACLSDGKLFLFKGQKGKCVFIIDIVRGAYKLIPNPMVKGYKPTFRLEQSASRMPQGNKKRTYYFLLEDEKTFRTWLRILTKTAIWHADHEHSRGGKGVEIINNPREVIEKIRVGGVDIEGVQHGNLAKEFLEAGRSWKKEASHHPSQSASNLGALPQVPSQNPAQAPGQAQSHTLQSQAQLHPIQGPTASSAPINGHPGMPIQQSRLPSQPLPGYSQPLMRPNHLPTSQFPNSSSLSPVSAVASPNSPDPRFSPGNTYQSQHPIHYQGHYHQQGYGSNQPMGYRGYGPSPTSPPQPHSQATSPAAYTHGSPRANGTHSAGSSADTSAKVGAIGYQPDKKHWPNERLRKAFGESDSDESGVEEPYAYQARKQYENAANVPVGPTGGRHYPDYVYVMWLNQQLEPAKLKVEDISRDLRNGVMLVRFLERVSQKSLPDALRRTFHPYPQSRDEAIENVTNAVRWMKGLGVGVSSSVTIDDIVDGDKERTFILLEDLNRVFGGLGMV